MLHVDFFMGILIALVPCNIVVIYVKKIRCSYFDHVSMVFVFFHSL